MKRPSMLLGASLALLVFAACGSGGGTASPGGGTARPGGGSSPATSPAAAACNDDGGGTAVAAVDFAFEPGLVNAGVGDTVTWTNNGDAPHTVTFDGGPDCGQIASGESISRTFDAAGTFEYVCTFHPQMVGTVSVTD